MALDHILLGMLAQPTSGYELRKQFTNGPAIFWSAEYSQIYSALRKMEKAGWLRSSRRRSRRGPPAVLYRRTAKGTAALERWLRSGPEMRSVRAAYIGQLIFLGQFDDLEATRSFLAQVETAFAASLEVLEAAESDFGGADPTDPEAMDAVDFHDLLSVRMGAAVFRARVQGCRDAQRLVEEWMKKGGSNA
jgi:DNA-binding PadR family transcriptional regulator